jgi:hypothetical protein
MFDVNEWITRYPLSDIEPSSIGRISSVVGPRDLAVWLQYREQIASGLTPKTEVATDAFVFGIGEPLEPHLTKVGGTPYRPHDSPWPMTLRNGAEKPMTFLAQFCFLESRDILSVPSDVLLIFCDDEYFESNESLCLEWHNADISERFQAEQIPPTSWSVPQLYGKCVRTIDYPQLEQVYADLEPHGIFRRRKLLSGHPERLSLDKHVGVFGGTKIGGVPKAARGVEFNPDDRFLCQLSAIQPTKDSPFPFLNHEPALSNREAVNLSMLLVDLGRLYFVLDVHENVHWQFVPS